MMTETKQLVKSFIEKINCWSMDSVFEAGDATAIFHKNVTYLLHGVVVGMGAKWRKGAEIGQTIGLGSNDF